MLLTQPFYTKAYRLSVVREGVEVGHAYLYLMHNDQHERPYGMLEDLYVQEEYRTDCIGTELLTAVRAKAEQVACYKLIGTSRDDGTRDAIHAWYERFGFTRYGLEFRMDLAAQ